MNNNKCISMFFVFILFLTTSNVFCQFSLTVIGKVVSVKGDEIVLKEKGYGQAEGEMIIKLQNDTIFYDKKGDKIESMKINKGDIVSAVIIPGNKGYDIAQEIRKGKWMHALDTDGKFKPKQIK